MDNDCTIPLESVNTTCQRPDTVGDASDGSCLGPLFCNTNSQCEALPTLGQGCAASNRCLGINLTCSPANVCVSLGDVGADCSSIPCLITLRCDRSDPNNEVCATLVADGQPCASNSDCDSGICNAALACEAFDTCY